jgi:Double zinc ribbon
VTLEESKARRVIWSGAEQSRLVAMTCRNCGSALPAASRFCNQCGAPQPLTCGSCWHENPPGAKFCNSCGEKLLVLAQAREGAPLPPSTSAQPRAERRPLTVMFCDLVGSTALSTRLDPEDLREVIAAYHACVADTVGRFHGHVAHRDCRNDSERWRELARCWRELPKRDRPEGRGRQPSAPGSLHVRRAYQAT